MDPLKNCQTLQAPPGSEDRPQAGGADPDHSDVHSPVHLRLEHPLRDYQVPGHPPQLQAPGPRALDIAKLRGRKGVAEETRHTMEVL